MAEFKNTQTERITRTFSSVDPKRLLLIVVVGSLVLGVVSGFILSSRNGGKGGLVSSGLLNTPAKNPQTDNRTFRDFAEGTIKAKSLPKSGEYTEGTHVLERKGEVPVALTSSVVDLSQYEGKKVKVFGETQKALKEGWLMDVGKVEEIK